jgi:hypothetical protein
LTEVYVGRLRAFCSIEPRMREERLRWCCAETIFRCWHLMMKMSECCRSKFISHQHHVRSQLFRGVPLAALGCADIQCDIFTIKRSQSDRTGPNGHKSMRCERQSVLRVSERVRYAASSSSLSPCGDHTSATVNSIDDWCIWSPPQPGPDSTIGVTEVRQ